MNVVVEMLLVLLVIVILILRKVHIGHAMFVGALGIFFLNIPKLAVFMTALSETLLSTSTWTVILAMFW